jgi:hypothetical protein
MLDLKMNSTFNNFLKVTLSELKHYIYGVEVLRVFRFNNIEDLDHIGVL